MDNSYKKLDAYIMAKELVRMIYDATKRFPDEEKFVPKPYIEKPTVSKTTKKKPEKKTAPKKIDLPTPASTSVGDQIDMFSMIGEVA